MMPRITKCPRCGRLYSTIEAVVCQRCEADEEADYAKISQALSETPGLSVEQVAEAAVVDLACVLRMLHQGRLQNTDLSDPVPCGQCGAPAINVRIRLCTKCLIKMDLKCAQALRELREALSENTKESMEGKLDVHQVLEEKRRNRVKKLPDAASAQQAVMKDGRQRMAIRERIDRRRQYGV